MKKSGLFVFLLVLFTSSLTMAANGDLGVSSGADGSESDPFLIEDFTDFQAFCADTAKWASGVHTRLETDLDLAPNLPGRQIYTQAPIAGDTDSDYTFDGTAFAGSFNGNNHVIKNLEINGAYYCGLFGKTESGCEITNLGLDNIAITGDYYTGGLCGENHGTISNCYATGSVLGNHSIGGLCGENQGTISNCYATGSVSGDHSIGGLCGENQGTISNCYATGSVSGGSRSYTLGGFCGYNPSGTIINCFHYFYGGPDNGFSSPLDDNELQTKASFIGFDFSGDSSDGTDDYWSIEAGYMPRLSWQISSGFEPPYLLNTLVTSLPGTGYSNDPFIITDYDDILEFRNNSSLRIGYYSLVADIDLVGITYPDAFIPEYFLGTLLGNGHVISNLAIDGESGLGFFKIVYGSVTNLGLDNIAITGDYYTGGLCGENWGTISNCYSTGDVSGGHISNFTGGLCGENWGTISNCYSTGDVSGGHISNYTGGLCGENRGSISNCYSTGCVSSDYYSYYIGGLCGENSGTISNCYSTGSVTGERTTYYLGGLCGENTGVITHCYSTGSIIGHDNCYQLGGICGKNGTRNLEGIISYCHFTGSVTGELDCGGLGGLCGVIYSGIITNCYSTGSVTGGLYCRYIGGFCGQKASIEFNGFWNRISNCYSTVNVNCGDYSSSIGGFCGASGSGALSNCYSTGNVNCGDYSSSIGGFCGANGSGVLSNSYSIGSVSGGVECTYLDGFCGYMTRSSHSDTTLGDISNCFWDNETSGISTNNHYYDKTTAEMQTQSTFTDAGWDFNVESDNGTDDLWHMPYNAAGYPILYFQRDIPGDLSGSYGINLSDFSELSNGWMIDFEFADLEELAEYWLEGK